MVTSPFYDFDRSHQPQAKWQMDRKKTFRAHVTDKGYYLINRTQIGKNYHYQLTLKTKI